MQPDEKTDYTSSAQSLCGVAINILFRQLKLAIKGEMQDNKSQIAVILTVGKDFQRSYTFRYCKVRNRIRGKISSNKEVYRIFADTREGRLTQDGGILTERYA